MAELFMQKFIDKRISNYLDKIDLNINLDNHVFEDKRYDELENKIWYKSNKDQLFRFYKNNFRLNAIYPIMDFYRLVPLNYPVEHFPLADMITKAMVNLVFNEKPEITVDTGNKKNNQILNTKLENIYDENQYANLLQKAAEYESYSGAIAFKVILDPDYSTNPIIMVYPKEDFEIVKKYDRVQAVIFKDEYEEDGEKYTLYSEYGKGYISYKLTKKNSKGKASEVDINSIPETAGLKRLDFYNIDGSPSNEMLAVYKENKTGAKSDYAGIIDDFQALDEVYSNLVNYIRKSKILTYMPENMCVQDKQGNSIKPSDYYSDYTIIKDNSPANLTTEAKRDVVDIQNSVNGYNTTFDEILKNALMTTGLSPVTVGYDLSGANSSGEALTIREKTSMRTRSEKIHRWDIALKQLTQLILSVSSITSIKEKIYIDDYSNLSVNVSFAEYESPTFDAIVQSLGTALNNGLIDEETALKKLWNGELSDDQIEEMNENIKNKFREKTGDITSALTENALEDDGTN